MRPKLPQNKSLKRRPIPRDPSNGGPKGSLSTVKGKKDKKDNKNKSGGGGGRYGAVGGYGGVKKKKVRRLVNGLMQEEINDLKSQIREIKNDSQNDMQSARTDYRRGVGDLNYVHGETGDYLKNLTGQTQQTYADQMSQTQAAQAALQAQLGGTYSGAASGADAEMARLGIQGGGDLGQLSADAAFMQGIGAQSGANAESSLGMAGANSMAGMQMLQGMNQGSFMSGIGQNLNARNDAFSEIRDNKMENIEAVRKAMQEAQGARKDMFFQLLQQLQQTGWDQYIQQQQLQMQQGQHRLSMRGQRKALGGNKKKKKK